jgi:hypothetical protein
MGEFDQKNDRLDLDDFITAFWHKLCRPGDTLMGLHFNIVAQ